MYTIYVSFLRFYRRILKIKMQCDSRRDDTTESGLRNAQNGPKWPKMAKIKKIKADYLWTPVFVDES